MSPTRLIVTLSLAAIKRSKSMLRGAGVGTVHPLWQLRAETCQRCPLLYVKCGKTYCGKPLLNQIDRDQPLEGCGCPVILKAKDPAEHCPRTMRFEAPSRDEGTHCNCVWCEAERCESTRTSSRGLIVG